MIRISEIFGPTIQGEGALIGQPTVFVRTGGCDYRCTWCDTLHAVDSAYRHTWTPMGTEEIFARVEELSGGKPLMISLSGGNPAIQDFTDLIKLGHEKGYKFACETQGSIKAEWFKDLDVLTLSPKPPSSNMDTDWTAFDKCIVDGPRIALKIVIFDDADYDYARDAAARYPHLPIYIQAGNTDTDESNGVDIEALSARMRWLVDKVTNDQWYQATVLPQLHVYLWGNMRGV